MNRNPGAKAKQAAQRRKGAGGSSKSKAGGSKSKISRLRKPSEMSLEEWQIALRREYGREQKFRLRNEGGEPFFSEFAVTNPQTKRTYRVAIRGLRPGDNFCSCADFAVNTLGTCKHIEFALAQLGRKRGASAALAEGFRPSYSEVYLRYGAKREVIFRPGTECPVQISKLASGFFDAQGVLNPEGFFAFDSFLKAATANGHEVRCYEDAIAFAAQVRDKARLADLVDKAFPQGAESPAFERLLKVPLYAYQREGALFAARSGRCLLADDMGLGKTIQAIAAAEILARTVGIERVLVDCPDFAEAPVGAGSREVLRARGHCRRRASCRPHRSLRRSVVLQDRQLRRGAPGS